MSEPKLKPCPFCGGIPKQDPALIPNNYIIRHKKPCVFYRSAKPDGTSWWMVYREDITAWNRRTP